MNKKEIKIIIKVVINLETVLSTLFYPTLPYRLPQQKLAHLKFPAKYVLMKVEKDIIILLEISGFGKFC